MKKIEIKKIHIKDKFIRRFKNVTFKFQPCYDNP